MNNNNNSNRGNNNRRRGRGNRQQGGGNQNRIDSRARGNAPQMLDKYRKLAQDAQHNGDRVQAEYYLQFADHYFRVIADSRARPDEARGQNRNEREFSNDEDGDEEDFDSARNGREDRGQDRQRDDRQRDDRPREDRQRDGRGNNRNADRPRQHARRDEGQPGVEGEVASEAGDNPFVRPNPARAARRTRGGRDNGAANEDMTSDAGEIDAAALPPSFSANASPVGSADDADDTGSATRKLPPRRRRKPVDEAGDGDSVTAVG